MTASGDVFCCDVQSQLHAADVRFEQGGVVDAVVEPRFAADDEQDTEGKRNGRTQRDFRVGQCRLGLTHFQVGEDAARHPTEKQNQRGHPLGDESIRGVRFRFGIVAADVDRVGALGEENPHQQKRFAVALELYKRKALRMKIGRGKACRVPRIG